MPATGRMPSVDASRFSMVARPDVPRSAFDVQSGHKTTFNAGVLVPFYVDEVLPGDSLRLRMNAFIRLSTPLVPFMDNLSFETFFFFVPNRLLWSNWQRFMGEQTSPSDTTTFLVPQITLTNAELIVIAEMPDYFGITNGGSGNGMSVSALPFRAYNLIWNEWFRDEDIIGKATVPTGDGPDTFTGTYACLNRAKRKDYFTSARPWPQKPINEQRFPGVLDPLAPGLGMSMANPSGAAGAPVTGLGVNNLGTKVVGPATFYESGGRLVNMDQWFTTATQAFFMESNANTGDYPNVRVLVNDIRTSVLIQQMLERNARGGSRYTEIIRSHFGVVSPDARLQRPELLGGGRTMIQVNPVAQTSASGVAGTTTKLGELAGVGAAMVHGHGFSQSFTEHGVLMGIMNVQAYQTYQQGTNRMWFRRTQYDFYWPGLAHLGEQAILNQELYSRGDANDSLVFGYQERWSEYKWKPSRTSGYFRSTVATPLDMWHLGVKYTALPVLNTTFIREDPPISRVMQVATNYGEDFLADILLDCRWVRPMPMFSIPGVGAHL